MLKSKQLVWLLSGLLAAVVLLGVAAALDLWMYSNYHEVKLGMTDKEVDMIVTGSGCDTYPNDLGGWDSYYFVPERGRLVVRFDANRRAVKKWISWP